MIMFYECPRPSQSHALKSPGEPRWGSRKTYVIHPGCARFARDPGLCWLTPSESGCMAQQMLTEICWVEIASLQCFSSAHPCPVSPGVPGETGQEIAHAKVIAFKRH